MNDGRTDLRPGPARRLAAVAAAIAPVTVALAQAPDGAAVFESACAECHDNPEANLELPDLEALGRFAPEAVLTSLMTGKMFRQGAELSEAERMAVAAFAAGRPFGTSAVPTDLGRCRSKPQPLSASAPGSGWNGWGGDITNSRFVPAERGGLEAAEVPGLVLKWAFGFPGVNSARAQPVVVGGRVFVGSEAGDLFALDAETGCTYWSFHAQAGIRAAASAGPYTRSDGSTGVAAFFADQRAFAYAVDADTGDELWRYRVDDHTYATSTGSPTLHDGTLYVVASGVGEEGQGGRPGYPCCTFRGSVTALDAGSGHPLWKTYTVAEPEPRGTSSEGQPLFGPAGGGVWAAPTIDAARGRVYVATGNGYADPPQPTTDAVLALDAASGEIIWSFQPLAGDVWAGGCGRGSDDNPNCPEAQGPDHDFSMPPVLTSGTNGDDVLVITQKSGMAYGVDPDDGTMLWQYRTSAGGALGGQWGMAADGGRAFVGVNGTQARPPGGLRAMDISTGGEAWAIPAEPALCGDERGCSQAQGAAVTAVSGAVFSSSMDGGLRAHASDSGKLIWRYDTNRRFETVNGVPANGGAMDGPGPAVAGGMVFVNSGYISLIGRPGNVLLAFGPE